MSSGFFLDTNIHYVYSIFFFATRSLAMRSDPSGGVDLLFLLASKSFDAADLAAYDTAIETVTI